jgi:hypothetical protein
VKQMLLVCGDAGLVPGLAVRYGAIEVRPILRPRQRDPEVEKTAWTASAFRA